MRLPPEIELSIPGWPPGAQGSTLDLRLIAALMIGNAVTHCAVQCQVARNDRQGGRASISVFAGSSRNYTVPWAVLFPFVPTSIGE